MYHKIDLDVMLGIIEDFELEWFSEHTVSYTDDHIDEFREARQQYIELSINEYWEAEAERAWRRIEEYENDPMVSAGWHQQDIIDRYRMER